MILDYADKAPKRAYDVTDNSPYICPICGTVRQKGGVCVECCRRDGYDLSQGGTP